MRLALTGARIWDGTSETTTAEPRTILIDRGEITSVEARWRRETGVREIPLAGRVALPGLIDAHVHLDLDPSVLKPDDQLTAPRLDRDLRMIARAERMLHAGITTARDLGAGDARELALRDAIARGELPGPRLLCAGQPVTLPQGHCHFWGGGASGRVEQEQVIRRQLERGVDWIKVMATGGVFTKGSGVARAQFDEGELRAMVELASQNERPVAAHCHGTEGIGNAARAGVRTIEHCSFAGKKGFGADLRDEVIEDLVASQAFVSPTVNAGWGLRVEKDGQPTDFFVRMSAVLGALRDARVPLIASSDAGIPGVQHHRLAGGLAALARFASLQPVDVLRSATSQSASALGLGSICGALQPGLSADVLVVDGDPLEDLSVLERPALVIARGAVVGGMARPAPPQPVSA